MATKIRPEMSKKNPYWISRERYYELLHFCKQYNDWIREYNKLSRIETGNINYISGVKTEESKVERRAIELASIRSKMDLVDAAAETTGRDVKDYILKGVIDGLTYNDMAARETLPFSRDYYYECYRRFFYELDKIRE